MTTRRQQELLDAAVEAQTALMEALIAYYAADPEWRNRDKIDAAHDEAAAALWRLIQERL